MLLLLVVLLLLLHLLLPVAAAASVVAACLLLLLQLLLLLLLRPMSLPISSIEIEVIVGEVGLRKGTCRPARDAVPYTAPICDEYGIDVRIMGDRMM